MLTRLMPRTLAGKTIVMAVGALILLGAVVVATTAVMMLNYAERKAFERLDSDMRVGWEVLGSFGDTFSIQNGQLLVGDVVLNDNHGPVDHIQSLVNGTATIFQGDTRITTNIMKPDGSGRAVGTTLARNAVYEAVLEKGVPYRGQADVLGAPFFTAYDPIKNAAGETIGVLYVGVQKSVFFADVNRTIQLAALLGAAFIVVLGAAAYFLLNRQFAPLGGMREAMEGLAKGDLDIEVPGLDRADEIGAMAQAVQVFKTNAEKVKSMEEDAARSRETAEADKRRTMGTMAATFEETVGAAIGQVSGCAGRVDQVAQTLSASVDDAQSRASVVATASEKASANVQTVASAAEELNASIAEIAQQVSLSSQKADAAVQEAKSTNEQVRGLSNAAQKIGDVIELINSIASQTNLLALNATIEAARAGEAGKGFAVVAAEVKTLAEQTAKATEDISEQISAIQGATDGAVKAIGGIGATIVELSEIGATVAAAVEEQGVATRDIAQNIQFAATGTQDVAENIVQVTDATGQTESATGEVLGAATELSGIAENLSDEVGRFLEQIRAA